MDYNKVTRGNGLLESFLSKKRAGMADRLIPPIHRTGRILDIGCGAYPYFLMNTEFREKYAIEKNTIDADQTLPGSGIKLINCDVELERELPFDSNYFDVISMLAVFEHIDQSKLTDILKEIFRTLKKGGVYLLTTPTGWTHHLLKFMARLNLVSSAEIDEHKPAYNQDTVSWYLQKASFSRAGLKSGYFEMFMNMWFSAEK